jgi:uncharacterized protein HemX
MRRQATYLLRFALTIALALGIVLSSDAQSKAHDLAKMVEIMAAHQAEIDDHGHAHEDTVDLMHILQGHSHEMADHDHNTSFLPPRAATSETLPDSTHLAMADDATWGRAEYGLDRPPRL